MKCNNGLLVLSLRLSHALLLCNKSIYFLDKFFVCGKNKIISCQIYFPFFMQQILNGLSKESIVDLFTFCISQVRFQMLFFFCRKYHFLKLFFPCILLKILYKIFDLKIKVYFDRLFNNKYA